jgi:hypothetical protein
MHLRRPRARAADEAARQSVTAVAGPAPLTAVQLREEPELLCRLVHGRTVSTTAGAQGPIALFSPGQLVAYLVETARSTRLYVFRTLAATTADAAAVPGVHPPVDLLLETRTRGATAKARNLFAFVSNNGYEVDSISDPFWLRVAGVLGGRRPGRAPRLPALLARERR